MKILATTLIVASAAGAAMAQKPASEAPPQAAKVYAEGANLYGERVKEYEARATIVAELAAAQGHYPQKNSPLSAEEVNESVQTLADGNRIVRKSSGKIYRNSAGHVRREMPGGIGGMLGTTYSTGQGISIASSIGGQSVLLNTNLTTARVIELRPGQAVTAKPMSEMSLAQKKALEEGVKEMSSRVKEMSSRLKELSANAPGAYTIGSQNSKYDVKIEELGTRDLEGVSATGTRKTTTIPADAVGNERPIEIVYERWFSKEIGLVVYSKNTDPRFGEQTYKLTNIVRAEPDPSLFAVPAKKLTGEPATVYRVVAGTPIVVNTAKPAKPQN